MKPDDTERREAVMKVCQLFYVRGLNHQQADLGGNRLLAVEGEPPLRGRPHRGIRAVSGARSVLSRWRIRG